MAKAIPVAWFRFLLGEFQKILSLRGLRWQLLMLCSGSAILGPLLAYLATLVPKLVILSPLGPNTSVETITIFHLPIAILAVTFGISAMQFERYGTTFARSKLTLPSARKILIFKLLVVSALTGLAVLLSSVVSALLTAGILQGSQVTAVSFATRLQIIICQALGAAMLSVLGVSLTSIFKTINAATLYAATVLAMAPILLAPLRLNDYGNVTDFSAASAMQAIGAYPGAIHYCLGSVPVSTLDRFQGLQVLFAWMTSHLLVGFMTIDRFATPRPLARSRPIRPSRAFSKAPEFKVAKAVASTVLQLSKNTPITTSFVIAIALVIVIPQFSVHDFLVVAQSPAASGVNGENLSYFGRFLCGGIWSSAALVGFAGQAFFTERLGLMGIRRDLLTDPNRLRMIYVKMLGVLGCAAGLALLTGFSSILVLYSLHSSIWFGSSMFNSAVMFFLSRLFSIWVFSAALGMALGLLLQRAGLAILAQLLITQGISLILGLIEIVLGSNLASDVVRTISNMFPYLDGTMNFYPLNNVPEVAPGAAIAVLTFSPDHKLMVLGLWAALSAAVAIQRFRKRQY